MEGYLFHIEPINDTTINLHLLAPRMVVTINDLNNPGLYLVTPELKHAFPNSIIPFTNIFHPSLSNTVELCRTKPIRGNHPLFREFNSPTEQFMLERGIKGPGLLKLDNVSTTVDDRNYASKADIVFIGHCDMPQLSIGAIFINEAHGRITEFYLLKEGNNVSRTGEDEGILLEMIRNETVDVDLLLYFNLHDDVLKKMNLTGLIMCDVYLMAQNLVKGRDYSLEELSELLLNVDSGKKFNTTMKDSCKKRKEDVPFKCSHLEKARRTLLIFEALDVLELSKQISEVCGCPLSKAFQNNRAERIEYLLLHELYEKKYLFPYKKGKDATYEGGLVLTPQTGFHENMIILLDFNSLYPSIIQEFNVCFSTIGIPDSICNGKEYTGIEGILPKVISILVNRRKNIKTLLKKTQGEERKKLDIRQKAIKLTANSIYGVLGCSFSRFSNYKMAAFITLKGRELLLEAKMIAEEQLNMKVVYGDTDSIMIDTCLIGINSNYQSAIEYGNTLLEKINAKYRNIEIEVENVFKKLILYSKKKYGALVLNRDGTSVEIKGLDFIRRDYANVASDITREVFEMMLVDLEKNYKLFYNDDYAGFMTNNTFIHNNGNPLIVDKIMARLSEYKNNIQALPRDKFIMSTLLKKDPTQYMTTGILPHIALALRMGTYKRNDMVNYIIGKCPTGTKNVPSMKAFHVSERCSVNYDYYIENQITPCIIRILRIMQGVIVRDIYRIFGIEKTPHEEFHTHQKITIITPCCDSVQEPSRTCTQCLGNISENFYRYKALCFVRREVRALYDTQWICEECQFTTRNIYTMCIHCNTQMVHVNRNKAFHDFLDTLAVGFGEFEGIVNRIEELAMMSDYRMVDLEKYFMKEVNNL